MREDMYLRIRQVIEKTGLSRATIYSMMERGAFPMKTALGLRAVGWLASEIDSWMLARKTVDKTGQEARPGRMPRADRGAHTSSSLAKGEQVKQQSATAVASALRNWDADWSESPPPTVEELEAVHARLRQINKKVKK